MSSGAPPSGSDDGPMLSGNTASLVCIKCCEQTTLRGSNQSGGRNPLKRICHPCASTDKMADRTRTRLKKKLEAGQPLDKEDIDVRAQIIKKTPEEKVEFYVNEKRKREEMECGEKRTIAEMKGSLEVGTEHSDDWLDIDNFETFEDYALRMIGLRFS